MSRLSSIASPWAHSCTAPPEGPPGRLPARPPYHMPSQKAVSHLPSAFCGLVQTKGSHSESFVKHAAILWNKPADDVCLLSSRFPHPVPRGLPAARVASATWPPLWLPGSHWDFSVFPDKPAPGWLYEELELVERRRHHHPRNSQGEHKDAVLLRSRERLLLPRDWGCLLPPAVRWVLAPVGVAATALSASVH